MFPQQILIQLPQHQMEIVVQVKIGSGTQGSVYQGFIKTLNQQVAIKVLKELNPREEKILQSIKQHKPKHIIRIYAIEKLKNQVYIVMELAEMDFFKFMNTNQFSTYDIDEKSELFLQMVQGVQEFHQIGYFHRDLKPENFVCCRDIRQNLTIKLIDFGCSKEQSDIGRQTLQVGTPYYMARDVLNSTNYTKEIDIWAMGAIWYEMITLQTFFQGINERNIYYQISTIQTDQIDQKIDKLDKCQVEFREIMKQMICIDHQKRIQLDDAIEKITQTLQKIKFQKMEAKIKIQLEKEFQEKEQQIIYQNQMKYENLYRQKKLDDENQCKQLMEQHQHLYEQKIIEKENELRKILEQKQQASDQNQKNYEVQKLEQTLQFQSQLNSYKLEIEQKYQQEMKQEMQLLQNKSKESLLYIKQKEDEENKKLINEEFQKQYQLELSKKQQEYQIQFQNQYIQEELNSKKKQLNYFINLLQNAIQNHISSVNQQRSEIDSYEFNNSDKQYIINQIQNFISQKQNQLYQISEHISNLDIKNEYQQLQFLIELESKYKNEFQIHIQENQMIQQQIQSFLISFVKDQQKNILLEKQEKEEKEIQQEMNDQVAKYQNLDKKFDEQQMEIHNIQVICEKLSIFNYTVTNQFKQLKFHADTIAASVNQLRIYYSSKENKVSRDLINYLQIQKLQIDKSIDKLQDDILQMKNNLSIQEEELKYEMKNDMQKIQDQTKNIEFKIQYKKKVNDEQNENNLNLLQQRLFNIRQLINQLNTISQTDIPYSNIKEYMEIKSKYVEEEKNFTDLSNKLEEQQQRQKQIKIIKTKQSILNMQIKLKSNQFQESIYDLKNQLSQMEQNCKQIDNTQIKNDLEKKQTELNNLKGLAKQKYDQIIQKTEQDMVFYQTIESLQEEANSIQIELENKKNEQSNQIAQLQDLFQQILKQCQSEINIQFQNIKDELQQLSQDFNQKQIVFMNFDIQNYNYQHIIEKHQLKQDEFQELMNNKMKNSYKILKQNMELIKNRQNVKKHEKFKKIETEIYKKSEENFQHLDKQIKEIESFYQKVEFFDLESENEKQKDWNLKQISIIEMNKRFCGLRGQIQGMQKSYQEEITTLQMEFKELKEQVCFLTKEIPSNDQIKEFQERFHNNDQSFLILIFLTILIKAFVLKKYVIRLQDFKEKQNKINIQAKPVHIDFREKLTNLIEANQIIQKYESFLKCKRTVVLREELIEDEKKIEKQIQEIYNYVKTVNTVKLRRYIKNQQVIKTITDNYFENLEHCKLEIFNKLKHPKNT
ncbi:unnamed protein product (macronuclear) [Paramecium tetraurelia]|uniref:Protein kinase domain-containing protein n=1 Tax=Paramecium tetraurelia TaxID=5888 RepID=A0DXL9_PARTE|nr:uncharacterized protein GSPATT00021410001 [Paramecium tetraurelia]CAK87786.1 unnamed protein product [Paramecium tetraurelia]|eukprot:XP_001455183.1 hypothetical protein (macronuclear) [Paramecium tetraurelia strain d4-2]